MLGVFGRVKGVLCGGVLCLPVLVCVVWLGCMDFSFLWGWVVCFVDGIVLIMFSALMVCGDCVYVCVVF